MSLSTAPAPLIKELGTGLHLVSISAVSLVKDNGQPITSEEGGMRLMIRFTEMKPDPKHFEQRFWAKSTFLLKMCEAFKVDATAPSFGKASMSKRGWIGIKEIHHIDGENIIEENGVPKIDYFIFDFYKWSESLKKPKVLGDPADSNGIPSGVFLDYKQVGGKVNFVDGVFKTKDETLAKGLTENAPVTIMQEMTEAQNTIDEVEVKMEVALNKVQSEPEYKELMETVKEKTILGVPFDVTEEPAFISLSQKLKPKTGPIDWTAL